MLNWSDLSYKLTLGIGCMALAVMVLELWDFSLSFWILLVVLVFATSPAGVFVVIRQGEMPRKVVGIAHLVASIWYVVLGSALILAPLALRKPWPRAWPVYALFLLIGVVPCVIVLYRWVNGGYWIDNKDE